MIQLAYLAAALGALALVGASVAWWKVAREGDREASDAKPKLGVRRVRAAASATAIAFGLLTVAISALILERIR